MYYEIVGSNPQSAPLRFRPFIHHVIVNGETTGAVPPPNSATALRPKSPELLIIHSKDSGPSRVVYTTELDWHDKKHDVYDGRHAS